MANEIRLATNVQVLQDVTDGGSDYSIKQHDVNAGSKSWGGNYSLPAFTDADVCHWLNGIIDQTTPVTVSGGAPFVTAATTDGTEPTNVLVIAVEFISEVGDPGVVTVTIGSQIMAKLNVGEGVVIPLYTSGTGLAIANVKIGVENAYDADTTEAHVNVMVAGR